MNSIYKIMIVGSILILAEIIGLSWVEYNDYKGTPISFSKDTEVKNNVIIPPDPLAKYTEEEIDTAYKDKAIHEVMKIMGGSLSAHDAKSNDYDPSPAIRQRQRLITVKQWKDGLNDKRYQKAIDYWIDYWENGIIEYERELVERNEIVEADDYAARRKKEEERNKEIQSIMKLPKFQGN